MASEQERKALEDLEDQHDDEQLEGQVAQEDEHHEDEGDQGQAAQDDGGGTDSEREAIRQARREERRARKDRAREREQTYIRQISSLAKQNQDLASRLVQLERRQTGVDLARVDSSLEEAAQAAEYWKQQIAVNAARGAEGASDLADAQEKFYLARRRAEDLHRYKQMAVRQVQTPPPVDTTVAQNAVDWAKKNRWYDPNGRDPDSRVVLAIDEGLAQEGFDARTPEYWEELDSRITKYLPHRSMGRERQLGGPRVDRSRDEAYNNQNDVGGSPVTGSDREIRGPKGSGAYRLSPERVAALKESGMWDNVDVRTRMIKRYKEMDEQLKREGGV